MNGNSQQHIDAIKDKKIVITGGTTGIGRATAVQLATAGSKLLIIGRHQHELEDAMNDLKGIRDDVIGLTADITNPDDLHCIFEHVDHQLDGIDILINNAAISGNDLFNGDYQDWKYLIDTNILGYIAAAKYASDRMMKQGHGHIVNIGSLSADERASGSEVYAATKAAIQAFSESLRKTVNSKGVAVSLIEPGLVGTDMQPQKPSEQRKLQREQKMLKAEDIAEAIMYCLTQPERSDVISVQIRPHLQKL